MWIEGAFFVIALVTNPVLIEVKQTFYLQNLSILSLDALILLVLLGKAAVSVSKTIYIRHQPFVLSHVRVGIHNSLIAHLALCERESGRKCQHVIPEL